MPFYDQGGVRPVAEFLHDQHGDEITCPNCKTVLAYGKNAHSLDQGGKTTAQGQTRRLFRCRLATRKQPGEDQRRSCPTLSCRRYIERALETVGGEAVEACRAWAISEQKKCGGPFDQIKAPFSRLTPRLSDSSLDSDKVAIAASPTGSTIVVAAPEPKKASKEGQAAQVNTRSSRDTVVQRVGAVVEIHKEGSQADRGRSVGAAGTTSSLSNKRLRSLSPPPVPKRQKQKLAKVDIQQSTPSPPPFPEPNKDCPRQELGTRGLQQAPVYVLEVLQTLRSIRETADRLEKRLDKVADWASTEVQSTIPDSQEGSSAVPLQTLSGREYQAAPLWTSFQCFREDTPTPEKEPPELRPSPPTPGVAWADPTPSPEVQIIMKPPRKVYGRAGRP